MQSNYDSQRPTYRSTICLVLEHSINKNDDQRLSPFSLREEMVVKVFFIEESSFEEILSVKYAPY